MRRLLVLCAVPSVLCLIVLKQVDRVEVAECKTLREFCTGHDCMEASGSFCLCWVSSSLPAQQATDCFDQLLLLEGMHSQGQGQKDLYGV